MHLFSAFQMIPADEFFHNPSCGYYNSYIDDKRNDYPDSCFLHFVSSPYELFKESLYPEIRIFAVAKSTFSSKASFFNTLY